MQVRVPESLVSRNLFPRSLLSRSLAPCFSFLASPARSICMNLRLSLMTRNTCNERPL